MEVKEEWVRFRLEGNFDDERLPLSKFVERYKFYSAKWPKWPKPLRANNPKPKP